MATCSAPSILGRGGSSGGASAEAGDGAADAEEGSAIASAPGSVAVSADASSGGMLDAAASEAADDSSVEASPTADGASEEGSSGAIGMSTAYRISDNIPGRTMEFRRRILHVGAAIGPHPIGHDEVYYVLTGEGEVVSDGATHRLGPGMAAYLYSGSNVGIRQLGEEPLSLIISYPVPRQD